MKNNCCSVDGCNNQGKLHRNGSRFYPRGFCNTHYKKFVKENRDIIDSDKIRCEKCSVDYCTAPPPYKKEMCNKHYTRFKKYEDVNFIQKRREGQTSHFLYSAYYSMKSRCYNQNNKDYPRYGGRGISIHSDWLGVNGFFNFINNLGSRPLNHTLDRKDTNGNYEPNNCRWADISTQNLNKTNCKFRGVVFYKNLNKYRARITVSGISYELGMFKDLEQAINVRKEGELKYLGKILDV